MVVAVHVNINISFSCKFLLCKMNKLISSVFAETTFQYCNVVPLHVEGGEAAAVK